MYESKTKIMSAKRLEELRAESREIEVDVVFEDDENGVPRASAAMPAGTPVAVPSAAATVPRGSSGMHMESEPPSEIGDADLQDADSDERDERMSVGANSASFASIAPIATPVPPTPVPTGRASAPDLGHVMRKPTPSLPIIPGAPPLPRAQAPSPPRPPPPLPTAPKKPL